VSIRLSNPSTAMRDWFAFILFVQACLAKRTDTKSLLIVHAYSGIDQDILWLAIETKIPELLRCLRAFKDDDQPSAERRNRS
jgi:hypothetical protein